MHEILSYNGVEHKKTSFTHRTTFCASDDQAVGPAAVIYTVSALQKLMLLSFLGFMYIWNNCFYIVNENKVLKLKLVIYLGIHIY